LQYGARVDVKDTEGNTPAHLAAKWCSREENYCNFKLVMTPLIRACPGILEIENNNGETPQSYLDKGAKRSAELHEENRLKSEKMKQEEDEREAKLDGIDEKRSAEEAFREKLLDEAAAEGLEIEGNQSRYDQKEEEEQDKETFDDWAERIAEEYERKRKVYAQYWGHSKHAPKRTATGGMATGKRNKEGRKRRKEQERVEYLDHQKRRLENYIKAEEAKRQDANMKAKEEYTAKVEKMKKSSDVLRYQDIPWPCEGTVQDMVDVMLADAKITEPNAYRKHIFRQQLTWHPDKFAQKTADRLHEDDKDKILTTVHHISQALNKALENSQLV